MFLIFPHQLFDVMSQCFVVVCPPPKTCVLFTQLTKNFQFYYTKNVNTCILLSDQIQNLCSNIPSSKSVYHLLTLLEIKYTNIYIYIHLPATGFLANIGGWTSS